MSEEIRRYNEVVLQTLEMGDLVEFTGRIYSHWIVYIGGCEIVHLPGIDSSRTATDSPVSNVVNNPGIRYTNACVRRENFVNVASESKAKKNNYRDRNNRPLSREEIKERALSRIGPIFYCVLLNNCEHFAVWCRYGITESQQVQRALADTAATGGAVATRWILWANRQHFATWCRNGWFAFIQWNGATFWVGLALAAFIGIGTVCYGAYTGGNDWRQILQ